MGWNGSDKKVEGQRLKVERRMGSSSSVRPASVRGPYRGIVAGLIVVAAGCGAIWWFVGGRGATRPPTDGRDGARPSQIAEVAPSIPTNKVVEEAEEEAPKEKPYWERDNTNGFTAAMIRKWKFMRRPKPSFTNDMSKNIPKLRCEIFPTPVENEIATFMTLEPGTSVIGMPKYGEEYDREFLKSCETPIVIEKDDDEYTRKLKKDMIQVKIELRERMRNGEKIGDILREERIEAQKLAEQKENVIAALRESLKEVGEGADEDLVYAAANKILEAKGIAPIKPRRLNKNLLKQNITVKEQGEIK